MTINNAIALRQEMNVLRQEVASLRKENKEYCDSALKKTESKGESLVKQLNDRIILDFEEKCAATKPITYDYNHFVCVSGNNKPAPKYDPFNW